MGTQAYSIPFHGNSTRGAFFYMWSICNVRCFVWIRCAQVIWDFGYFAMVMVIPMILMFSLDGCPFNDPGTGSCT